jgi:hypothetical protein
MCQVVISKYNIKKSALLVKLFWDHSEQEELRAKGTEEVYLRKGVGRFLFS